MKHPVREGERAVRYTSLNVGGEVWAGDKTWESFNEYIDLETVN